MTCRSSALRKERVEFLLPQTFSSVQSLSGLDDAHQNWGGLSTLWSLRIQMLISSGNTLPVTPGNNV